MIHNECLGTQHRLWVMDLVFKSFKVKTRSVGMLELDGGILLERTLLSYQRILKKKVVGS